jgi:hypothetical protein
MNKLDMNLFAFVAWLERNRHAHSEDRLTINDGYEWYNYMWNKWLQNSDIGKSISNGDTTVMGINNIPDTNTDENITTDKNTNHPRWTSTTTWDNLDANNNQPNTKIANPYEDNCVYIDELMLSIYVDMYLDHGHFDFNVPEWIDDEWDGDAEKELASDVLYSFRMFLENRDWVDEDNEDRDAAKWGDFIIQ